VLHILTLEKFPKWELWQVFCKTPFKKKSQTPLCKHKAYFCYLNVKGDKKSVLRIGNKSFFLKPLFELCFRNSWAKDRNQKFVTLLFPYEHYREIGSTSFHFKQCTSSSISDTYEKTQNPKGFRTIRVRLEVLTALPTCSRKLKHEGLRGLLRHLQTSPNAIHMQHSRKQSYLHQKPGRISQGYFFIQEKKIK